MGAGASNTSALAFGGNVPPYSVLCESWNGSSWTEVGDLNTARAGAGSNGTQTSSLVYGGAPSNKNETESWNGSSWTELNNLNTGREGVAGAGTDSTSALAFGTHPPVSGGITEDWNGVSWSEVADLSVGRGYLGGTGTKTNALAIGGQRNVSPGAQTALTEEWSGSSISTEVLTD
jgi:hypothetical protein